MVIWFKKIADSLIDSEKYLSRQFDDVKILKYEIENRLLRLLHRNEAVSFVENSIVSLLLSIRGAILGPQKIISISYYQIIILQNLEAKIRLPSVLLSPR